MNVFTAKGPYGYSRGHRLLEVTCIVGVFVQFAYLAQRCWVVIPADQRGWGTVVALVGGYFAADFISGLAHWAGDTLGTERTPVVGPNFILPFRKHHADEKDITRHGFVETNGNNCVVCVVVLMPFALAAPARGAVLYYSTVVTWSTAVWMFGTNQFHKWAHADRVPPVVALLQRWHLILSAEQHQIHHRQPHDTYYCITHGLLNPLLHQIRFFRVLEWSIGLVAPRILFLSERQRAIEAMRRPVA